MIVLEIYELKNICMDMAELGAAANQKMVEPKADRIKQREVYRWLKSIGQKPCLLEKLVSDGLVHKKRMGKAINSPVCYSKLEIQAALNALKMDEYINK